MKKLIRDYINTFKSNIGEFLEFEILFRVLCIAAGYPVINGLISYGQKLVGSKYLTLSVATKMLQTPKAWALMFVVVLWLVIFASVEISSLFVISFNSKKGARVSFRSLLQGVWQDVVRLVKPKNLPMVLWVFFVFTLSGSISTFLQPIRIPEVVIIGIKERLLFQFLYLVFVAICYLVFFRWIFIYICFYHENLDYKQAKRRAVELIQGYFWRVSGLFILNGLIIYGLTQAFVSLVMGILTGLIGLFKNFYYVVSVITYITQLVSRSIPFFFSVMGVIGNLILMEVLYKRITEKKNMKLESTDFLLTEPSFRRSILSVHWRLIIVALAGLVVYSSLGTYAVLSSGGAGEYHKTYITAHRGNGNKRPENTKAAIESAFLDGADFCEIDVQLDKDGEVLLCHDRTFKRTGGLAKRPGQLTKEEVRSIEVGSYFSEEFRGEPVPYLEEVFKDYKGRMKFNIELKPYGEDPKELACKVVQLIYEHEFEHQCLITSLSEEALKQVMVMAPELEVGFITPFIRGSLAQLPKYDAICVEVGFVNPKLVAQAQVRGQAIHVWTVNHQRDMDKLLLMGVDHIITDETAVAVSRRGIYESKTPFNREVEKLLYLD